MRFRVSDAWEGRVRFVAMHGAKGWSLRRLWFEDPALEVASNDGARWFVVTPRSKINPLRGSKLQLPTLSCVGEEPKADRRLVISVTAQGDIFVEGRKQPQSLDQVHAVLRKRARDPMLLQPDGSSALVPLLDIDASMPWVIGQWLLMLCAAPDVKATTVAFGVMHRGTLRTGALTIELPQDRSVTPVKVPPPLQDKAKVKLFGKGTATSDPRLLYELLARLPKARNRQTLLEVVTPPP